MPKAVWIICGKRICTAQSVYKSQTWKCLTESDSQLPLPALPHRQTDEFLKADSAHTRTRRHVGVTSNAQGNKHTAAVEPWWISKKISETIEECHLCTKMSLYYYSAEIIVTIHQIRDGITENSQRTLH